MSNELVLMKRNGIERLVQPHAVERWKADGFEVVGKDASVKQSDGKPLNKMTTAELDAKAAELGVEFPETATNKPLKVEFLEEHLKSQDENKD